MGKSSRYLFAIAVVFTLILGSIMFHDDGVPDTISEREKTHVLHVLDQASVQMDDVIRQMDDVIRQMNLLTTQDKLDLEACTELADLIDSWSDTMDTTRNDPVFFVPFTEANEASLKLISKIKTELDIAASEFGKYASVRKEENNQEAFDVLRKALTRKEKVNANAPCITGECTWCRSREALKRFLARHAN